MAIWFTHFLHERIELLLEPLCIVNIYYEFNRAVLNVTIINPCVNTNLSSVKLSV